MSDSERYERRRSKRDKSRKIEGEDADRRQRRESKRNKNKNKGRSDNRSQISDSVESSYGIGKAVN
jgi:hypothetical protein